MELSGKMIDISLDIKEKKQRITFLLNTQMNDYSINELKDCEKIDITVKKHREKRSLNANSYFWVLTGQIADILRTDKDEIYLSLLERYGQSLLIPVKKGEKPNGYFKYYKYISSSIINGKDADWYKVMKGSSEFDTKEMSILIDGVVSEAKELGIETATPEEIERMKQEWN